MTTLHFEDSLRFFAGSFKKFSFAIIILLFVLMNYSLLLASPFNSVSVEYFDDNAVPLWAESVQGKGSEEFLQAVRFCKDRKYEDAFRIFTDITEKYPNTNSDRIAVLYIGSIFFRSAKLKEKKDMNILMKTHKSFKEGLTLAMAVAPQEVPPILIEVGKVYIEMEKFEEAMAIFQRLLNDYPASRYGSEALYLIALTYEKTGRYKEAIQGYRTVIQEYPENKEREGFFGIAGVFVEMNEYGEAKKIYDEGLRKWPSYIKGRPQVLYNYSEVQFQNGLLSEAREGFLNYFNLYPKTTKSCTALKRVADTYLLEHKAIVAEKIYREAMAIAPTTEEKTKIKLAIGDLKFMFGTDHRLLDEAVEYYKDVESASGNNPTAVKARYKIAKVLESQGKVNEAINIYSALLSKSPDANMSKELSSALSVLTERLGKQVREKMKKGDYAGAVLGYQKYLKQTVGSITDDDLLMDIAYANSRVYLTGEAVSLYQKVVDRNGDKREKALYRVGELYFNTGEYGKAVEALGRYITDFPQGEYFNSATFMTGESLYNLKEYDKAANYFYAVLRGAPYQYPTAYVKLSDILLKSGKLEEGAVILNDLLTHSGKGKDVEYKQTANISLGNAYFGLEKYQEALDAYRSASNYKAGKEDSDTVQFMIGDCLMRLNKKEDAKRIFSRLADGSTGLIKQVSEERMKDLALVVR
ncbi:MAG: tetratricopeptide repeat protein [Nitrospirae bacterium]|nr:tetratricopeptide repeat protein [Nitrospirota bacterium]